MGILSENNMPIYRLNYSDPNHGLKDEEHAYLFVDWNEKEKYWKVVVI